MRTLYSLRPKALVFVTVFVSATGCNGLIGDTNSAKSGASNDPVGSVDALATQCASDDAPGTSWSSMRRLTSAEVVATFSDLVGADVLGELASYAALLPDDTVIGTPEVASATYTEAHVDALIELVAEIGETVAADTTLRKRVVGDCAANASSIADSCISTFITTFGSRALRHPLTTDEVDAFMASYASTSPSEDKLPLLIMEILAAPDCVFINERGVDGLTERTRLTPYEVATRIAYQTTGSMPDDTLFAAAASDSLKTVDQVRAQVYRLLQSDRGRSRLRDFARFWLKLDDVPTPAVQTAERIGADPDALRTAALTEIADFFENLTLDNGATLDDLFSSPLAFARDAALTELYGLDAAWDGKGAAPASPTHKGLLNRVGYLFAQADSTSPIMRAVHFRERVMCAFVDPPDFSIISTRTEQLGEISRVDHSTREAVSMLTANAQCSGCHTTINPPGYVFETFGPLGEFRTEETVYDSVDTDKVVATHDIDTRVDDLSLGADAPASASNFDDLLAFVTSSSAPNACVAQHLVGFINTRSIGSGDWCGAESVARTLEEGGSFAEAMANAVAKEDIFWRGAL